MMDYTLNDLMSFIEISNSKSISEAARRLNRSQPSLTESLLRIERSLGFQLFYRSKSGIQLTANGRSFQQKALNVQSAIELLNPKSSGHSEWGSSSIRIGCHATIAQYCLPETLKQLQNQHPDFRIELHHDLSRHIQSGVQKGIFDLGLVINPTPVPDLVIKRLATDRVCVWSSESKSFPQRILADPELIQVQSILRRWKNRPHQLVSSSSLELIARLAFENLGLAILPERIVTLLNIPLRPHFEFPTYEDQLGLIYRPEFGKIQREKDLIHAIKESLLTLIRKK